MCKCDECTGGSPRAIVVHVPPAQPLDERQYAVEVEDPWGYPAIVFRGTLRECTVEALRIENYDGPNA